MHTVNVIVMDAGEGNHFLEYIFCRTLCLTIEGTVVRVELL